MEDNRYSGENPLKPPTEKVENEVKKEKNDFLEEKQLKKSDSIAENTKVETSFVKGSLSNFYSAGQYNRKTDVKYVKAYVGDKYDKFKNNGFNFYALIFGPLYMFYRKMPLLGLIFIILVSTINTILSMYFSFPYLEYIIEVACLFLLSINVNKIYLAIVNEKVDSIISKGGTEKEILDKCKIKGGASLGLALIGVTLILVLLFAFSFFGLLKTPFGVFGNYSIHDYYTGPDYDGREINVSTYVDVKKNLDVETGDLFLENTIDESTLSYELVGDVECDIKIYAVEVYMDPFKLRNQYLTHKLKEDKSYQKVQISGEHIWYGMESATIEEGMYFSYIGNNLYCVHVSSIDNGYKQCIKNATKLIKEIKES